MSKLTRREFNRSALALLGPTACSTLSGGRTPSQGEGPYYPVDFPADADNNLVQSAGSEAVAQGDWLRLEGRLLDAAGQPIGGAAVEIWEADYQGIYNHPTEVATGRISDRGFRGFGRAITAADGSYEFLTIVPVPYTSRPPHIHVKIKASGHEDLTTQLYLKDHPTNTQDGWFGWMWMRSKRILSIDPVPGGTLAGREIKRASYDFTI